MKDKDIFDELDEIYARKTLRIEKVDDAAATRLAELVVKKFTKQRAMDLSAIRKALSELRTSLVEAKSLLKAAKDTQNRLSIRRASTKV